MSYSGPEHRKGPATRRSEFQRTNQSERRDPGRPYGRRVHDKDDFDAALAEYQASFFPTGVSEANPKDLLGLKKTQVGLLPAAGVLYGARAMENGAVKYGPYNWRTKKVKMSIYLDAMERHIMALRDGENVAADSQCPHLGHIIACAAILADATAGKFLIDDRPAPGPAPDILKAWEKT